MHRQPTKRRLTRRRCRDRATYTPSRATPWRRALPRSDVDDQVASRHLPTPAGSVACGGQVDGCWNATRASGRTRPRAGRARPAPPARCRHDAGSDQRESPVVAFDHLRHQFGAPASAVAGCPVDGERDSRTLTRRALMATNPLGSQRRALRSVDIAQVRRVRSWPKPVHVNVLRRGEPAGETLMIAKDRVA
jgi:hypothetical protein